MNGQVTRRELLTMVGTFGAGVAIAGISGLPSKAEAKGGSTEKWPWPYVKLDPEKTAELAYNEWYRVFCGAAVISSVFSQLRKRSANPTIPFPSMPMFSSKVGWWAGEPCAARMPGRIL